jgi:hypothetical protein
MNSSGKGFTFNKMDQLKFQFDPFQALPEDNPEIYLSEIKKVREMMSSIKQLNLGDDKLEESSKIERTTTIYHHESKLT